MPITVDVPNLGSVEFPDGTPHDEIVAAIQRHVGAPEVPEPNVASDSFDFLSKREPVPRAPQMESKAGQVAAGVYNGAVAPALDFMASPAGMAASSAGVIPAVGRGLAAIFAPVMAKSAYDQGAQAISTSQDPNATLQQVVEPAAGSVSSALMALGAGRHAVTPSKPLIPAEYDTRGKNQTTPENMVEGNQETPHGIQATTESIQDIPRVPDMQGERSAGGAGLPSPEPQREGIELEHEGEIQQGALPDGTAEMRDPMFQLPSETSRGETPATQEPAPRTIETVGEGQLFRNDEVPFNLVGETDTTAAEAAKSDELKAAEEAKAAQDAAQIKMFEEPAEKSQAPAEKSQVDEPKTQAPAEKSQAEEPADPHMAKLEADMQKARDAGDDGRLATLAKLKINYMLEKPPAIKKVQELYGDQQPDLTGAKKPEKQQTKMQIFAELPVAKFVIENGGFLSATQAKKVKGMDWWNNGGKDMYEALGRIPPAYGKLIFAKSRNASTPDDLMSAVGVRNSDGGYEATPFGESDTHHNMIERLMAEIESSKGGKSTTGVTGGIKTFDQHMQERESVSTQQANTKGLPISVDEFSPGDTIHLPSESGGGKATVLHVDEEGNVTLQMPFKKNGKIVTMPAGSKLHIANMESAPEAQAGENEPF